MEKVCTTKKVIQNMLMRLVNIAIKGNRQKKDVLQHKSYLFGSLGWHIKQVLLNHGSYLCHKTVRLGISVPKSGQVTMITPVCSYLSRVFVIVSSDIKPVT